MGMEDELAFGLDVGKERKKSDKEFAVTWKKEKRRIEKQIKKWEGNKHYHDNETANLKKRSHPCSFCNYHY